MADIFISYSKADRAEARLLSAFLESQGFSVWWDSDLIVGDKFRDVIAAELTEARVAIVIWTKNSVTSDWVQSEAGRALREHKLIPLRSADTEYNDIPPPFDNIHTLPLNHRDQMLEAVAAQIAKPLGRTSGWNVARFEVLTWFGVVGGAITLVSHISSILSLSKLLNWLVVNWSDLLTNLWQTLFFFHFSISPYDAELGTIIMLMTSATIYSSRRQHPTVVYRKVNMRIWTRVVFLSFPISAIATITLLGVFDIDRNQERKFWVDFDSYINRSFSDARCASRVRNFLRNPLNSSEFQLQPGEGPSAEEKAEVDNCFMKYDGTISKEDLFAIASQPGAYEITKARDDSWLWIRPGSTLPYWLRLIIIYLSAVSPFIIAIVVYCLMSICIPIKITN